MVKYIFIKSPDEWATTKQACRDKRVVRLNLFLYLIYIYIYIYIVIRKTKQRDYIFVPTSLFRDELTLQEIYKYIYIIKTRITLVFPFVMQTVSYRSSWICTRQ